MEQIIRSRKHTLAFSEEDFSKQFPSLALVASASDDARAIP
jgi:hypothetical protein